MAQKARIIYAQTHTGYMLYGLREIARACHVSRPTLMTWITEEQFPVAVVPRGDQHVLATTYGLIDTWLFARYLANQHAIRDVLDETRLAVSTYDVHDGKEHE